MSEEIKKMNDELQKNWNLMKDFMTRQETEMKATGAVSMETKASIDAVNNRMNELEIKLANNVITTQTKEKGNFEVEKKEFDTFMRNGGAVPEILKKTMISGNDTTGGYFVIPDFLSNEIIKDVVEYSPIRSLARVRQTMSDTVKIPKRATSITGGAWTSEIGTRSSLGQYTFGMEEVPVHELTGYVDISNRDLADSQFNLEAELNTQFAEQLGVTEGTAFVSGNGVGKPSGIISNAEVIAAYVANGHATEIQADALIDLYYGIKTAYVNNSQFLLNRNTLKEVRKLKDGNGNYLWMPGIAGTGKPSMILDRPYTECVDMPDIGANTYAVAFGDFRQGYIIIDRTTMEMSRDPYTQMVNGTTRFYVAKRVGGQVIKAEAVKILKISAS